MAENLKEEIEDKVIDCINAGAIGRLVIFKPEKSDKDLIVEKRSDYKKKTISLKIYGKELFGDQGFKKEVKQLVDKKEIKPDKNFYLMFVHFDIVKQDIKDKFLFISSLDFQKTAKQNDFSKFLINKKDFGKLLIEKLDKK